VKQLSFELIDADQDCFVYYTKVWSKTLYPKSFMNLFFF